MVRPYPARKATLVLLVVSLVLALSCRGTSPADGQRIEVSVDKARPRPGDAVQVSAVVQPASSVDEVDLEAVLLVPTKGAQSFALTLTSRELGLFKGEIRLAAGTAQGFYAITVADKKAPAAAAGKAGFIVGKVVGDFMIASAMPAEGVAADAEAYMRNFMDVGGNMLIVHDIINKKAWYPSKVCAVAASAGSADDRVGLALGLGDRLGLPAMITVVWDMTTPMPHAQHMDSMKAVMRELWGLYGRHPSLLGFYDYQEGSGTYFAAHVREFADAVKALNKGLLSGCAPYVDDPLLAGYLAAIDSLDVVIYQGAVMASYRPDNRKMFPLRRTRDFAALSAGAMLQKKKVALSHVELFGYMERSFEGKYLAGPEDAFDQILSAASCYGPDGITLFTYHHNVHTMGKTVEAVKTTAPAVVRGLRAFNLIAGEIAVEPGRIAIYLPYNDWWVDRWTECFLPALDAFRRLGLAAEILPFIPPRNEEILPYYPFHMNEEQLEFLLAGKYVLVLPDISGMQDTDSLLLKAFVERGGTALLFGPRIPFGDGFDRAALVGGKESKSDRHYYLELDEALFTRVKAGRRFRVGSSASTAWKPAGAKSPAVFEDGSAAVLVNAFGKGAVVTVPLSITEAAQSMPDLVRDVLDFALARHGLARPFDIEGIAGDMDVAMTSGNGEPAAAVMNYEARPMDVAIFALNLDPGRDYVVTDLKTGAETRKQGKELYPLRLRIKSHDFAAFRIKAE